MWPILPTAANSQRTPELREVVQSGVDVWAFDYPSYYKGDDKKAFEQKVLDHFWTRQIGAETVGRFLHYFRRTVREIMPLYIQRYHSVDLMNDPEIRPLDNYNMVEEYESQTTGKDNAKTGQTANHSNRGTSKASTVQSTTPQSELNWSLNPTDPHILATDYASQVEQTINDGNDSGESKSDLTSESSTAGTEKHRLTRRGNIGVTTYAQLVEGYRQTFLNIDMEIINDLESCFLGVY